MVQTSQKSDIFPFSSYHGGKLTNRGPTSARLLALFELSKRKLSVKLSLLSYQGERFLAFDDIF